MNRKIKSIINSAEVSEKSIERYLVRRVTERHGLCLKFYSSTDAGYPDRIVLLPGGITAWVELKSMGQRPRPLQRLRIAMLQALSQTVCVCDSKDSVDNLINNLTK